MYKSPRYRRMELHNEQAGLDRCHNFCYNYSSDYTNDESVDYGEDNRRHVQECTSRAQISRPIHCGLPVIQGIMGRCEGRWGSRGREGWRGITIDHLNSD